MGTVRDPFATLDPREYALPLPLAQDGASGPNGLSTPSSNFGRSAVAPSAFAPHGHQAPAGVARPYQASPASPAFAAPTAASAFSATAAPAGAGQRSALPVAAQPIAVAIGLDELDLRAGRSVRVAVVENDVVNGHILVTGKSGAGKSTMLRRIVRQIVNSAPVRANGAERARVHVLDVHGDLDFEGSSSVTFSEACAWGINPLRLSADPHFGGVRKRVQAVIEILNDSSTSPLGARQVGALRNLLYELYAAGGFMAQDSGTWAEELTEPPRPLQPSRVYLEIPFEQKDRAKEEARAAGLDLQFDRELRCWHTDRHTGPLLSYPVMRWGRFYPTMHHAATFAKTRLKNLLIGGGVATTALLEAHCKRVAAWQNLVVKAGPTTESAEAAQLEIAQGAEAVIAAFSDFVNGLLTGRELDSLLRYDSLETMRSLVSRLETLVASGIYGSAEPPFDPRAVVQRHDLRALSWPEKQLYVWSRLTEIFERALERGLMRGPSEVRDVVVLDEAAKFFLDKDSNVVDMIAREGRKFGIWLIAASQAPTHFSEDFLGTVGTKIVLGLDDAYRDQTIRKMRMPVEVMDQVEPGRTAAVQITNRGASAAASRFRLVRVNG